MRNIEHDTRNAIGEMRNIERDTRNAIREILKAIREILKAIRETRYAKCEILNAICEMRWAKCDMRMSPRGLHTKPICFQLTKNVSPTCLSSGTATYTVEYTTLRVKKYIFKPNKVHCMSSLA